MKDDAPSPADRFERTLAAMRASVAAEGPRKGPAAALAAAILSVFECLLALLRQFEAGTLVAVPARRTTRAAGTPCDAAAETRDARLRPARADRRGDHEPAPLPESSSADRPGDDGADRGDSAGEVAAGWHGLAPAATTFAAAAFAPLPGWWLPAASVTANLSPARLAPCHLAARAPTGFCRRSGFRAHARFRTPEFVTESNPQFGLQRTAPQCADLVTY